MRQSFWKALLWENNQRRDDDSKLCFVSGCVTPFCGWLFSCINITLVCNTPYLTLVPGHPGRIRNADAVRKTSLCLPRGAGMRLVPAFDLNSFSLLRFSISKRSLIKQWGKDSCERNLAAVSGRGGGGERLSTSANVIKMEMKREKQTR